MVTSDPSPLEHVASICDRVVVIVGKYGAFCYVLLTTWQVKIYGPRLWKRLGFGVGTTVEEAREHLQVLEDEVIEEVEDDLEHRSSTRTEITR